MTRLMSLLALLIVMLLLNNPLYSLNPVILNDSSGEYFLGLHLEYLEDKEKRWSIKQIASKEFSKRFIKSHDKIPNFKYTKSAYWVRFRVKDESSASNHYLIVL